MLSLLTLEENQVLITLSKYENIPVMILWLVIVCLVLITEIATWWYDHRAEQKNNTLPSHGIEPCTSCFPGRRINHCTRKECWSFVSFRLMFEGEHFEHNTSLLPRGSRVVPLGGVLYVASRPVHHCYDSLARYSLSCSYHRNSNVMIWPQNGTKE